MKKNRAYLGFITPGFILYTLFMIIPIIFAMYYSFFEWNGIGPMKFVGFANFQKLLGGGRMSRIFFNALGNNIKYLICVLLIITPLQIFFAYILFIRIRGHRYIQFMLFLPYVNGFSSKYRIVEFYFREAWVLKKRMAWKSRFELQAVCNCCDMGVYWKWYDDI